MQLDELRSKINDIDGQILELFQMRMDCAAAIANYKKDNNLPIFVKDRELFILHQVKNNARAPYKESAQLLFSAIMDISKHFQQKQICPLTEQTKQLMDLIHLKVSPPSSPKIAYFGMPGSFCHKAAFTQFPGGLIKNLTHFSDIFHAVSQNKVDFGVVPIDNSTAGSIHQVYHLLGKHNVYINQMFQLKIDLCLAARLDTNISNIKHVLSHSQPLTQCEQYLSKHQLTGVQCDSTAKAAYLVSQSTKNNAAICSEETARQYGLKILKCNIQDSCENYTRFIVISNYVYTDPKQNTVSIAFSLPHATCSLYNLLAKFAMCHVNLTKIESQPIGNKNFDVMFYLDFEGDITQPNIIHFINILSQELKQFKFLGCFKGI